MILDTQYLGALVDGDESARVKAGLLNGEHLRPETLAELDGADSVVAAHGLLREEPVVSNDTDFQDVEGLTVVTY